MLYKCCLFTSLMLSDIFPHSLIFAWSFVKIDEVNKGCVVVSKPSHVCMMHKCQQMLFMQSLRKSD